MIKDSEFEKLRIENGIIDDDDDYDDDDYDDNSINEGFVCGMGESVYSYYDETGRYLTRLRKGTLIKLINKKIEMNHHNPGLMIQIKFNATSKGWIGLKNTSFIKSKL